MGGGKFTFIFVKIPCHPLQNSAIPGGLEVHGASLLMANCSFPPGIFTISIGNNSFQNVCVYKHVISRAE